MIVSPGTMSVAQAGLSGAIQETTGRSPTPRVVVSPKFPGVQSAA